MNTPFLNDVLSSSHFTKLNDNHYYKIVEDQKLNVVHYPNLDNDLGHCVEFLVDDTLILMAHCINETDFMKVLNTFNV